MTTITLDEPISLRKTHFRSLSELYEVLYEEQLEKKLQGAKEKGIFVDV